MFDSGENIKGLVISELDKHLLAIVDSTNNIKAIFNKIDDQMINLKKFYTCSSATALYNKYENFNDDYAVIIDNLMSYYTDLMTLKKSYASTFGDLTQNLRSSAAKLTAGIDEYKYKEKR